MDPHKPGSNTLCMSVKLTQDLIHAVDKNKIYKPHANMVNKILIRYLEGHRDMFKELHTNVTPPPVATEEASPKRTYEQFSADASDILQPTSPKSGYESEDKAPKRTYRQMQAEDGSYEKLMKETRELFDTYKHAPLGVDSGPLAKLAMEKLYSRYASYCNFGGSEMKPDPDTEVTIGDMVTKVLGQIQKCEFASVARYVEGEYQLKHKTGPRKFLGKTDVYPVIHKQDITDFVVQWWRNTYKPVISRTYQGQYSTRNYCDF